MGFFWEIFRYSIINVYCTKIKSKFAKNYKIVKGKNVLLNMLNETITRPNSAFFYFICWSEIDIKMDAFCVS